MYSKYKMHNVRMTSLICLLGRKSHLWNLGVASEMIM